MKQIDKIGLKLCNIQGNIFSTSVSMDCGSATFIRRFMYSEFAKHLDTGYFLSEASDISNVLNEVNDEYISNRCGKKKYSIEELYWIGYIYRYFCYTQEKSSKTVFKIINSTQMRQLYLPYHSLDPQQAIDRIIESKNLKETDLIAKGVKIYRTL